MSKKGTIEVFQTKISRNDRFAQMSHQEKLIEQKKKEIQAKLEAKKVASTESKSAINNGSSKASKSPVKVQEAKKAFNFNTFSNDGSFLNQFKQLKEKKPEHKKLFKSRESQDSDERNRNKWKQRESLKDRPPKPRVSRFSDKPPGFEQKISISTSYSNLISQQNFDGQSVVTAQDVTGQPLLKNLVSQNVQFPVSPQHTTSVIAAPPILLNVPPPQIQLQAPIVIPPSSIEMAVDLCPTTVITTVALSQQTSLPQAQSIENSIIAMPTIELASIPPPNPIQVHNIPQPEPINALTIPPPAPMQVQNIPPPSPIQLNEIPNPKPLDVMNIPTPSEQDKNISDPDFIKNVPPPNKSVPPPSLPETNVPLPQQKSNVPTCLPPPNIMPPTSMPPPPPQNLLVPPPQTLPPPPPQTLQLQAPIQLQTAQAVLQTITPPQTLSIMNIQTSLPVLTTNPSANIPPLMAQPVLPPPGMGIVPPPPMNLNCPPPQLQQVPPLPPTAFISQTPPPQQPQNQVLLQEISVKDLNAVVPPGSAEHEAMASLGRMVAQCGPGIEDVVRQRKNRDPSLWFLFHKESTAYHQYQALIEQFKNEMCGTGTEDYRPEDIYENEYVFVGGDDCDGSQLKAMDEEQRARRKKRKSRWGEKAEPVAVPGVVLPDMSGGIGHKGTGMLSKVTRTDPGLVQYAINTFGSSNLSEEDWTKAEDHYKINMLYQDMLRKRAELERLNQKGQNKYDYDSDEDIEGGTWEHKLREKEMVATQMWAAELNRQAEGKHHIGDFLPPEELKKFMEKSEAAKEGRQVNLSDYKEFKLKEDNVGFKMMQKLGWTEGQGLGVEGQGILEPVNKGIQSNTNQGFGLETPDAVSNDDDEYDAYRKRMMLAYRFRPNPLNNPRRSYY